MTASGSSQKPSLLDSIKSDWRELSGELWGKKAYIAKALAATIVFLVLQVAFQLYFAGASTLPVAMLRAYALAGATLIGAALCLGPLANFKPQWNFIEYRRTIGVAGFALVYLHAIAVIVTYFNSNPAGIYYDLNPFRNPIIFGSIALGVFSLLLLTSTDWAISKLGFRNWKSLHRLIYPAFVLSVLHFVEINPPLMFTLPGYLLLAVTLAAMVMQLAGYARKVQAGKAGAGALVGIAFTVVSLLLFAVAFFFKNLVA